MRKQLSKTVRQQVYDKCGCHCAYCGCELEYKDMQVDHAESVYRAEMQGHETDNEIGNLMPACRQYNFYKGANDIEGLRQAITNVLSRTCVDNFQARMAMKYGIIKLYPWDGKFYFEKNQIP